MPAPAVPIPYVGIEIMPVTVNPGLIQSILTTIFQAWDPVINNAVFTANSETNIIPNSVFQGFASFIPVLPLHTGPPLTISIPPPILLQSVLFPIWFATFVVPGLVPGTEVAKATALGQSLHAAITVWAAAMTVTGTAFKTPATPLISGLVVGSIV